MSLSSLPPIPPLLTLQDHQTPNYFPGPDFGKSQGYVVPGPSLPPNPSCTQLYTPSSWSLLRKDFRRCDKRSQGWCKKAPPLLIWRPPAGGGAPALTLDPLPHGHTYFLLLALLGFLGVYVLGDKLGGCLLPGLRMGSVRLHSPHSNGLSTTGFGHRTSDLSYLVPVLFYLPSVF